MASNWNRIGDGSDARQLGANIAALIFGDRRGAEEAYRRRMVENIDIGRRDQALQQDILKTRQDTMKTDARTNIGDHLMRAGMPAEQAAVIQALIRGESGSDFSSSIQGWGHMQNQGYRQKAVEAALTEGWAPSQAHMLGVASGPQDLFKVDNNMLMERFKLDSNARPTPIGAAQMAADRAREVASYASASRTRQLEWLDAELDRRRSEEHNAKMAGQWNPGGVSGASSDADIKRAFTRERKDASGYTEEYFDRDEWLKFLQWQRDNGGSLNAYLTRNMPVRNIEAENRTAEASAFIEALEKQMGRPLSYQQRLEVMRQSQAGEQLIVPHEMPTPANTQAGHAVYPTGGVAQKIQQAKEALAQGVDPAWLREQLGRQGINPAAAGL